MVLVTAPRSFLSKRSFVWKMSALSTPYFTIAAWKQYQSVNLLRILLCFAAIFYMYILKTISKFKFALLCRHLQHDNVLHQLEAGTGCVYLIYRSRAEGIHQPAQFLVRKRWIIFDLYMSLWSSQDVTYVTSVTLVLQKLNLQRMTPFCKASAYPWFCGHSPTTTWVNLDSDSGANK